MRRAFLLICGILPFFLNAQDFHLSVRGGLANYQGDLQKSNFTLNQAKWIASLGLRYDVTEHITARTYFSYGKLAGDDSQGTPSMKARNLSFQTSFLEWELGGQYNFFSLNDRWWTPYLFAGVGLVHYNPYTYDASGAKVNLQPLSTEGEGLPGGAAPYKLTQLMIPFGMGAEYALNEDMRVGLELGYRKMFTDYLDDVSGDYFDAAALLAAKGQTAVDLAYRGDEVGSGPYPPAKTLRGNDRYKDGYYYIAVTFTIRSFISSYRRIAGLPAYRKEKKVGCPANRAN